LKIQKRNQVSNERNPMEKRMNRRGIFRAEEVGKVCAGHSEPWKTEADRQKKN